ncbi:hypothetical protein [Aquimarina mytili]|uniref:Uncharacterized protein n=1 Tax=Aquimarina mytili TaxID=874423 RepID=A0A937D7V3_9FLAO|nr:hypothetical protein [Aquimarina mytili]MBL0685944.1 hypothetical protein [Aquimarina mytili]
MNKVFSLIIFILLITSCSEGDIIENDIDFNASLESCSNLNDNTFVFYKIDDSINQALSLGFTSTTFEVDTVPEDLSITIPLNETTNTLFYRKFGSAINGADYFCASVPPSGVTITQELIGSDGSIVITYTVDSTTSTETIYNRNIALQNVTIIGADRVIRQEVLEFGSDKITITN